MPNELYIIVVIRNVDDVFDPIESVASFEVKGVFLDLPLAQAYAPLIADNCNHGDRVGIFGYNALKSEGYSEVLCVVVEGIN